MREEQFFRAEGFGWYWLGSKDVTKKWERCPACNGKLPSMLGVVTRYIEDGVWPAEGME